MKEKFILDSSFILALALEKDTNKERALKLKDILSQDCYINNNVLNEIVTLTNLKGNFFQAITMYHFLIDNCKIINEYEISNYNEKTMSIFKKFEGKLSFTDSSIIVTMKEHNIENLVSFNKQFQKETSIHVIN